MPQLSVHSPVGDITISEDEGALVALDWGWGCEQAETPLLLEARTQLLAYFNGKRTGFDLPLRPHGTPYRLRVWQALHAIPFGATRPYGALAEELGGSARSIGLACGANPLPVITPCHRVTAAGGGLGGYTGPDGPETKRFLLQLEQHVSQHLLTPLSCGELGDDLR